MRLPRKHAGLIVVILMILPLFHMQAKAETRGLDLSSLFGSIQEEAGMEDLGGLSGLLELFGQLTGRTMKDCTISKIPDQTYTGSAVRPVPTITCNGEKLKRGTDFTLSYQNNIKTGTAKCVITGKGMYSGKRTVSFKIVKASANSGKKTGSTSGKSSSSKSGSSSKNGNSSKSSSSSKNSSASKSTTSKKFTVKLSVTSYTYSGAQKKPAVKVTAGGKSVTKSDYTVTYKNNKNVGNATVTVKGKGDYKGYEGSADFRITLKKTALSSASSPSEGTIKAGWNKDGQADGYELWMSTSKTFSSSVKKVKVAGGSKQTYSQTGLTSGKKYYVRIRSWKKVGSRNWYSVWSAAKQVTVK